MTDEKQEYMERLKKYHGTEACGKYEGFGEVHHLREWARLLSIPHGSLHRYLQNGLTIEEVAEVRGVRYPTETVIQE
jgi:hypothetical protein